MRNSTFVRCATMDMMVTRGFWWDQPRYGGLIIENNVFTHSMNGSGWHVFGFLVHGQMGQLINSRVVNNTFETLVGGMTSQDLTMGAANTIWANNIGSGWDCVTGATFAGNVGRKCAASDVAVSPSSSCAPPACSIATTMPVGWVNPAQLNFRLNAGSPAINAGSASYAPATDRDGNARSGAPDAGAYEYGGTAPDPTPTPTPTPTATATATAAPTTRPRPRRRIARRRACRRA